MCLIDLNIIIMNVFVNKLFMRPILLWFILRKCRIVKVISNVTVSYVHTSDLSCHIITSQFYLLLRITKSHLNKNVALHTVKDTTPYLDATRISLCFSVHCVTLQCNIFLPGCKFLICFVTL